MSALGPKSEAALRAAMARLLDGRPERTDCELTVANQAREAQVVALRRPPRDGAG